jgi:hypothetical protein
MPLVLVFLLAASLGISYLVVHGGLPVAIVLLGMIVGLPVVYATLVYPKIGIVAFIAVAFIINYVSRFSPETPIGIVMDVFTYLLIIGFFLKQKNERDWTYFDNAISYFVAIWFVYNMLEAFNPASPSILAWIFTVRTVAFVMLMYFVFVFQIRTKAFIKLLIKIWLLLAVLGALSAWQQENLRFFDFERKWLMEDPLRLSLLFINNHVRKFAIFSDPVVFSYNMVAAGILCITLILGNIRPYKKVVLAFMAVFFLWVMLYSGTRAAYILFPAAMGMLAVLNFNKKVVFLVAAAGIILAFFIFVPTSNPMLVRFQTAFKPTKDASFNVRAENQKKIKPYILSHPIGGGLGSVGVWGQRFAPNSLLAKFPPDSGYVRVAVETGWIGLFIFCTLMFVILYTGINYYYLIHDPELKTYCLAMVLIIFALGIGNYPQQAFVQYPTNILFFLAMAILVVTMRLDIQQRKISSKIAGKFL